MQNLYASRPVTKLALFLLLLTALTAVQPMVSGGTFGGFSVRAIIPDNQIDKKQTYFDLKVAPGEEQDIEIVITNSKREEITVEVSVHNATTARNGLIVYTKPDTQEDISAISITDMTAPLTQMVTIPPLASKTATIHLRIPDGGFKGVLLGGIAVTGKTDGDEQEDTSGVSLKNTITYVTALKLTEDDREVAPDFELVSVGPELVNYKTSVVVQLRNNAARIVKGMEVKAAVYNSGSDSAMRELLLERAEMAPSSKGSFVIDWGGQALKPGTYRLRMTADYNGRLWEWDEEFVISSQVHELNKNAVGMQKSYVWLYLLAGALLLALVFLLAYLLGRRQGIRENEEH